MGAFQLMLLLTCDACLRKFCKSDELDENKFIEEFENAWERSNSCFFWQSAGVMLA